MAVFISLTAGAINVNSMNRGSVVAVGEISQPGWNANGKTNFGNGQAIGTNLESGFVTTVFDNDIVDNPISSIEPSSSIQSQAL